MQIERIVLVERVHDLNDLARLAHHHGLGDQARLVRARAGGAERGCESTASEQTPSVQVPAIQSQESENHQQRPS